MNVDFTKSNVGNIDRIIRAVLGVLLILSVFSGSSWVVGVIGAVLLTTAYFRFCLAYTLFDFSSNKEVISEHK
ncbi:hypothetical protein CKO12_13805 [Chromatium okenii]|nr:DUF2892 domain-containing protein [Chromatium okenii]MBK1642923.1 hypothetical protein [Chromatium okenii]